MKNKKPLLCKLGIHRDVTKTSTEQFRYFDIYYKYKCNNCGKEWGLWIKDERKAMELSDKEILGEKLYEIYKVG